MDQPTDPAARAVWAAPTPDVTVEFLEGDTRVGGREVSLCKADDHKDIRCEVNWLHLETAKSSVNSEVVSCEGIAHSAALVTADFSSDGEASTMTVTVQLASLGENMEAGYRTGYDAGLTNLVGVAERTMVLERLIKAPRKAVCGAWMNPDALPQWWGPDGFSCRTQRIDLRTGGEWVFDMIGPDGTVYPNHHLYHHIRPDERIAYSLLWGENGPKHADAWATLEEQGEATKVTLAMIMNTVEEYDEAKGFGAIELGQQRLGKLERYIHTH